MRNEVPCEYEQVWVERFGEIHGPLYPSLAHIGAEMNITDLSDAEVVELFG